MKNLVHEHKVRVRYEETDKMGVVYSGKYFVYFEVGRTELLRSKGYTYRELEEQGIMLPVVETHCRHKAGAFYDDLLVVYTKAGLKRSLMRFDYEIKREGEDAVISTGYTVHAFINAQNKIISAPENIKALFSDK